MFIKNACKALEILRKTSKSPILSRSPKVPPRSATSLSSTPKVPPRFATKMRFSSLNRSESLSHKKAPKESETDDIEDSGPQSLPITNSQ